MIEIDKKVAKLIEALNDVTSFRIATWQKDVTIGDTTYRVRIEKVFRHGRQEELRRSEGTS